MLTPSIVIEMHTKTPLSLTKANGKRGKRLSYQRGNQRVMPTVPNQHFTYLTVSAFSAKNPQTQLNQLVQLSEVLDGADHLRGVAVLARHRFGRCRRGEK